MSAEGIDSAAKAAQARSDVLTGKTAGAQPRSRALAAALARAAAAALEAGNIDQGWKLLEDAKNAISRPSSDLPPAPLRAVT